MLNFKTIPFVRILLPFVLGILTCEYYQLNLNLFYLLIGAGVVLSVLFFMKQKSSMTGIKNTFVIVCDIFLVISAVQCSYTYNERNKTDFYGNFIGTGEQLWKGRVEDLSKETDKFYRTTLVVEGFKKDEGLKNAVGKVLVYFKKPFDKNLLKPGNELILNSAFVELKEPLNPNEFNYRRFCERKNIFHSSFVDSANVKLEGKNEKFSLTLLGLEIKQNIISVFKNSALTPDAVNLCNALITGYDDEVSAETINAFAHSGTLHVLSVSGLHTGILYAVLLFLFGVFDRNKRFKLVQVVLIVLSLGFFALITGFSPPVLRAVIMLSLIVIGKYYFNYSEQNTLNIIAVSAFGMLVFDPNLLFDAGFLLSYSAMIGIIYFAPYFSELIDTNNPFFKKVWQLTSVSIAATLANLPIALVLFHQFPLWFILSNLFIIPLCSIVMLLAFLLLLKLSVVEALINLCSAIISYLIHLTDKPGWGYIDSIDFTFQDAILMGLTIFLFTFFLKNKSYLAVITACLVVLIWQSFSLLEVLAKKESRNINIYHINKQFAIDFKNKTDLNFISSAPEKDVNYHIKPNHTAFSYPEQYNSSIDYLSSNKVRFFHYKNVRYQKIIKLLRPDYLLISNNSEIESGVLQDLTTLKLLIVDGSNSYKQVKQLKQLCATFGIPFYNTRERGYLAINL